MVEIGDELFVEYDQYGNFSRVVGKTTKKGLKAHFEKLKEVFSYDL